MGAEFTNITLSERSGGDLRGFLRDRNALLSGSEVLEEGWMYWSSGEFLGLQPGEFGMDEGFSLPCLSVVIIPLAECSYQKR